MKSKLRNLLLALLCILIFAGAGILLYQNWIVQKPFAVILFLVPGLDTRVTAAARLYSGGSEGRLAMEQLPNLALIRLPGRDRSVAGPVAAATTYATGQPGTEGSLSTDGQGKNLTTLLQEARTRGRLVGLVTNGRLASPTLGAFYAPGTDPTDPSGLATNLLEVARPDVALGGGLRDFLPELKGGLREDGRDLTLLGRQAGYDIVRNRAELSSTPTWRTPQVLGLFSHGPLGFSDQVTSSALQPSLADMTRAAIQFLQFNRQGYFLVVEAALISDAARQNQGERVLKELLELDAAVQAARDYAGDNAVILVAGTVNPGGLQLNGTPMNHDSGLALLARSPEGIPALTWSTGPGGISQSAETSAPPNEPVAVPAKQAFPVAGDLLGLSLTPSNRSFSGYRSGAEAHALLRDSL